MREQYLSWLFTQLSNQFYQTIASVASDECDLLPHRPQEATMWLGTEDGHINVYNCTDNIRIKKNKEKFLHPAPVLGIL